MLLRDVLAAARVCWARTILKRLMPATNLSITLAETRALPAALNVLENGFEHIPAALAASGETPLDLTSAI